MKVKDLITKTKDMSWQEKLKFVCSAYNNIAFSTSFSIEDQAITDVIIKNKLEVEIFAIDTGRLPNQTYELWQETLEKYQSYDCKIKAYYPDVEQLEKFVSQNGINPFYKSKELRLACCNIRKVEPLKRALKGKKIWISGVRKEHSVSRGDKEFFEYDDNLKIIKFYPLLEHSEEQVWQYIKENNIPYNKLYDQGYRSIGCDPCSRAVAKGEDIRAGRWWWEEETAKECGLHMVNGKLVRKKDS